MSYAAAELAGDPLLAIGDGFSKTDLEFADGIVGYWPGHRRPPKALGPWETRSAVIRNDSLSGHSRAPAQAANESILVPSVHPAGMVTRRRLLEKRSTTADYRRVLLMRIDGRTACSEYGEV